MDNQILISKLRAVFAESAIQTVGDLVDAQKLPGLEKLPAHIRAHSLTPDSVLLLPTTTFVDMHRLGIPTDSYAALVGAVGEFRMRMVDRACAARPRLVLL